MQYRSTFSLIIAAGLVVPALAGCDSLNRALGKEKVIPGRVCRGVERTACNSTRLFPPAPPR